MIDINLNDIIKRKNFQNYLEEKNFNMGYDVLDNIREKAICYVEDENLKERLTVLKNQINFLTNTNRDIERSTFTELESKEVSEKLNKINEGLDVLNLKKDSLNFSLNEYLTKLDVKEAVNIKGKLNDLSREIDLLNEKRDEINKKVSLSGADFDLQLIKIREKYNDVDILSEDFNNNEFSDNVVFAYKKERAIEKLNQFLDELTPEKRKQVIDENNELKELINVGENI